ncbi:hypothetical protein C8R44DRAFT_735359 [Mycena epipterygia]|nr:hypothetical protein C8R44DRAFT_735359 [Mycena epipterygia]
MCDTIPTLQTSIVAGTQSLVSGSTFGYMCLGLACASPAIYVVYHQLPSKKLARLEDSIKVAEGILKRAKEDCARDHVDLLDLENRLLQLKFSVSEIRSQMLDEPGVPSLFESNVVLDRGLSVRIAGCYGSLKKYLQTIRGITKSISKCRKEVEKIHTSTLCIIEEERRRKLFGAMREVREVIEVLRSPTRHVHLACHRGQSSAGNFFQDSYTIRSTSRAEDPKTIVAESFSFVLAEIQPEKIHRNWTVIKREHFTPVASFFETDTERAVWNVGAIPSSLKRHTALVGPRADSGPTGCRERHLGNPEVHDYGQRRAGHATHHTKFGFEKLQYYGLSLDVRVILKYGSILGATFAALFPAKVECILIDGAPDSTSLVLGQLKVLTIII